jgi:vancomycin resistance protein YoaR
LAQSLTSDNPLATGRPHANPKRRVRASRVRWPFWLFLLLLLGLLGLAAMGGVAAYEFRYLDHIYPGVQVSGIPLAGLTLNEAEQAIADGLTPYPGPPVILRYGERTWSFTPDSLGVAVDARATAKQAFAVGRSAVAVPTGPGPQGALSGQWHSFLQDLADQWQALRHGYSVTPQTTLEEGKVTYSLMQIARDIDTSPREGSLTVSGLDVISVPGQSGREVDVEETRQALLAAARAGQGGGVALLVQDRQPVVTSVADAAAQVTALLSQPLSLVTQGSDGTQRFAVDRPTLRQWLQMTMVPDGNGRVTLHAQMDRDQVTAYLQELAAQVNRPVQNAALNFNADSKQLTVLKPSQVGQEMDIKAGVAAIEAVISTTQPIAATEPRAISIPVAIVHPKIDSSKVAEMGITDLISQGATVFKGSSNDRTHNIVNAAGKFTNVVVAPGDDFSFDDNVGDVTAANGFVEGLVIAAERTAVGIGGGVCQVSTTAFRAALNGGFPITQRYAHGYVVGWYGKPGMDATIYTPDVDFRFRNDTGHYILVRSGVDLDKGELTFYIYGTPTGRKVEIADPVITNVKESPAPLYQLDKTLASGTVKQVDWAVKGLDALVVRKVTEPDGTVREDKITSHYQPWRAIYLYGPGAKVPAGSGG